MTTSGCYSDHTLIARLTVNFQSNQAISDRKTVRQPKRHLSKAGVWYGTHIFRDNVMELSITIGESNSNC